MPIKPDIIHFAKKIVHCEDCGSRKLCFASFLNPPENERLISIIDKVQAYSKGQHLFRTGEKARNIYIIKSGVAKSYLLSDNGDEQVIGFNFPGEILGLDDLTSESYSSGIVFLENANVCIIAKSACEKLAQDIPQLSHNIINRLNKEIKQAHQQQLIINHLTAEQRIACFILELSERMKMIGLSKTSFKLSMSRTDIASYLGLATETASRLFKKLERDSLIQVNNKRLNILDFSGLSERTHTCDKCSVVLINGKSSTSN